MLYVYKASAGSGKTHTLANQYIKLLFANKDLQKLCEKQVSFDKFKNIISITFTNKAAAEIKERIIQRLDNIRKNKAEENELIEELTDLTSLTREQVIKCADLILRSVLHNYSYFFIGTIDSFFQRVLRAFAMELNLPAHYQIELDTQKVASDIIDAFFDDLENNTNFGKWLADFAIMRTNQGKSWNIINSLKELTNEVFKEQIYEKINSPDFQNIEFENIDQLKNFIDERFKNLYEQFYSLAEKITEILKHNAQKNPFLTYFKKLTEGQLRRADLSASSKIVKQALEDELDTETLRKKLGDAFDAFNEFALLYNTKAAEFITLYLILENYAFFGILNALIKVFVQYKLENNLILISEVPFFLSVMLSDENVPFIYERLGSVIKNVMIDEFQDTSRLQWSSFVPLIKNAIAENNMSMIVGDAKQSLYRWRNGDFRLLLYDVKEKFGDFANDVFLETNYRSLSNIVEFNNKLFERLPQKIFAAFLSETNLQQTQVRNFIEEAYKHARQKPFKAKGGNVKLYFITKTKEGWKEIALDYLTKHVDSLLEKYNPGDIVILVRQNSEAETVYTVLSQYFREKNKDVNLVSDKSLILENSRAIRLIISAMNYITGENKDFYGKATFVLMKKMRNEPVNPADLENYEEFLPAQLKNNLTELKNLPLYELAENIISIFDISPHREEIPYLRSFQDLILEFMDKYGNDLNKFLTRWELGDFSEQGIMLPDKVNAIRIMTIHKSKGLSFKVVLVPFIDWDLGFGRHTPVIWTNLDTEPYNKFPFFPVSMKKIAVESLFKDKYYEELLMSYMDTLNILYVAFTRPETELYAYFALPKNPSNKSLASVVFETLKNFYEPQPTEAASVIEITGETGKSQKTDEKSKQNFVLDFYPSYDWKDKISIRTNAPDFFLTKVKYVGDAINYGNIMHEILSKIEKIDDYKAVVNEMYSEGLLDKSLKQRVLVHLKNIFKNPEVRNWFSDKWIVKTEESILTSSGEVKRPDRVLISEDEIIVIDYKFGEEMPEHKDQILEYMDLISKIEKGKKITGYLYYGNENRIVKFDFQLLKNQ